MLLREISNLEDRIKNGDWHVDQDTDLWGGADLAVRYKRTKEIIEYEKNGYLYVISKFAREISALICEMRDIFRDHIDYYNKYEFYGRLGERANNYIETSGDDLGVLMEIIDEAKVIACLLEGRLYFAYGSNMDENQMVHRCPTAHLVGKVRVEGYKFIINERGVASIIEEKNSFVEGILWGVQPDDEKALDRYEGVSLNLYYKREVAVCDFEGNEIPALVYLATNSKYGYPRKGYLEKIVGAAKKFKFKLDYVDELNSWFKDCEKIK